jgi:hypothetical protein
MNDRDDSPHRRSARDIIGRLTVLLPLVCAGCIGPGSSSGPLQPQSVSGPCEVKKFYVLRMTRVYTDMTIDSTAQACRFTLFNPDLQLVELAALITEPPIHGRAQSGVINGDRMAAISYTPTPGYVGSDRFTTTIEPGDKTVTVNVTVRSAHE